MNKKMIKELLKSHCTIESGRWVFKQVDIDAASLELEQAISAKPIVSRTFAVGKKVKVEHCFHGHEFDIGEVVAIVEHEAGATTSWLCTNGKASWWLSESEANCC